MWAEVLGDTVILFAAIFTVVQRDTLDAGTSGLAVSYALQVDILIFTWNFYTAQESEI